MTRGRKPDPGRARRGTGHVPQQGKKTTKVVPLPPKKLYPLSARVASQYCSSVDLVSA